MKLSPSPLGIALSLLLISFSRAQRLHLRLQILRKMSNSSDIVWRPGCRNLCRHSSSIHSIISTQKPVFKRTSSRALICNEWDNSGNFREKISEGEGFHPIEEVYEKTLKLKSVFDLEGNVNAREVDIDEATHLVANCFRPNRPDRGSSKAIQGMRAQQQVTGIV
jgi:hypothetical protein